MSNIKLIEKNRKLKKTLEEIANPDWKECTNYISAFEKAQRIADDVLRSIERPSFYVLKQFDGKGPIYKLEVCSESLEILDKEIINGVPEEWSTQDFYELLEEGKRLDVKLEQCC